MDARTKVWYVRSKVWYVQTKLRNEAGITMSEALHYDVRRFTLRYSEFYNSYYHKRILYLFFCISLPFKG